MAGQGRGNDVKEVEEARSERGHGPAWLRCLCLPWAPTLRPAVPACSDLEGPLGKGTALWACHPGSGKRADSRQATR